MTTEAERCYIAGFEDEGRVPEDKEFTQSLEAAKKSRGILSWSLQKNPALPQLEFNLLRLVLNL